MPRAKRAQHRNALRDAPHVCAFRAKRLRAQTLRAKALRADRVSCYALSHSRTQSTLALAREPSSSDRPLSLDGECAFCADEL
eukprot:4784154-Pleurochrysis_carterae.AAC.1